VKKVRQITVFMPEPYLLAIADLVRNGYYASRAEAIRLAIRDLFQKERVLLCDRGEEAGK